MNTKAKERLEKAEAELYLRGIKDKLESKLEKLRTELEQKLTQKDVIDGALREAQREFQAIDDVTYIRSLSVLEVDAYVEQHFKLERRIHVLRIMAYPFDAEIGFLRNQIRDAERDEYQMDIRKDDEKRSRLQQLAFALDDPTFRLNQAALAAAQKELSQLKKELNIQ